MHRRERHPHPPGARRAHSRTRQDLGGASRGRRPALVERPSLPHCRSSEMELLGVHPAAGHGDHAGAAVLCQAAATVRLRARTGPAPSWRRSISNPSGLSVPFREDGPGVVDHSVEPWFGFDDATRQPHARTRASPCRRRRPESAPHRAPVPAPRRGVRGALRRGPRVRLAPQRGERSGRGQSEAGGGASDEDSPASEGTGWRRPPAEEWSPDQRPEPREAAHDGDLEGVVDQVPHSHATAAAYRRRPAMRGASWPPGSGACRPARRTGSPPSARPARTAGSC